MSNEKIKDINIKFAIKKIQEPVILNRKLLWKQINTLSQLIRITNNEISDNLIGINQVLELFEYLPKGEYVIKVVIK